MKYCPNPSCPTLLELGIVAEYDKRVSNCVDCGTELISADAPPLITPQPAQSGEERKPRREPDDATTVRVCPNPECPTMVETGVAAEYQGHVLYCADCGTPLISAEGVPQRSNRSYPTAFEFQSIKSIKKVCPNPNCPTLIELGFVAEYEGDIEYCEDCGTALVRAPSGPAEEQEMAQTLAYRGEGDEDTALLASFATQEDLDVCVEECKRREIPVIVRQNADATGVLGQAEDAAGPVPVYDLYVRRDDLFRAMNMLVELFDEDAGDEDEDEQEDEYAP